MKKAIALTLFLLIATAGSLSQDGVQITVKQSELINGIVIVTALEGRTSLELQCNEGMGGCKALEPGTYIVVRLPKNRGLYDCANAEVYRKSADIQSGEKVGAYCIIERK